MAAATVLAPAGPAGAGSFRWDVATWSSPVLGTRGPVLPFTVRTEAELGYDADRLADEVVEVLGDPRSWAGISPVRFQLVAGGATTGTAPDRGVAFTVLLATPSTVDALCAPLATRGRVSCRSGDRVVINADRWRDGPGIFHPGFADRLDAYRTYVVNHEVGHRLGRGHVGGAGCRPDRYAPVMLQQTYGLQGCAPNGWPAYDGRLLGREPDASGPAPSGPCDPATVHPWTDDDRPLDDAVTRLYRAILDRSVDQAGAAYWRYRRATGLSAGGMATELLASPEGSARTAGLDDGAFVTTLYRTVLGREPDPAGRAHWVGRLASGLSRADLVIGFADSAELVAATGTSPPQDPERGWLTRLYGAVLDRHPDCAGVRHWTWSPARPRAVVRAFLAAPEFAAHYGPLDDGAFVDALYANVLGRPADPAGRAYWTGELASGRLDRSKLVLTWLDAPELVIRTGTEPPLAGR